MANSRLMLGAVVAAGLALPVAAQAESYYVVQNTQTKKCSVMTAKPTASDMTTVGSTSYTTEGEANSAMKTATECK